MMQPLLPVIDLRLLFHSTDPIGAAPTVFWSVGYYPAGTRGVGPPGAMFVMSTEDWWGGTWYVPFRR
jgi:hypothetical protein